MNNENKSQPSPTLPENPPAVYRLGECCTAFDSYTWSRNYVYVDTPAPVKPGDAVAITLKDSDEVVVGYLIGKATQKSTVFCFHKNGCPWPQSCSC